MFGRHEDVRVDPDGCTRSIEAERKSVAEGDQEKPEYRVLPPFGPVPISDGDGFVLFETGAIVLHIGERSETLLPKDL